MPVRIGRAKQVILLIGILSLVSFGLAARTPAAVAGPFISVTATVDNTGGGIDLVLVSWSLDHGCWTNNVQPPEIIGAHSSASFEAESCGAGTGAEGHVLYRPWGQTDSAKFDLYFDDPFVGTNSGDLHSPNGCTGSRDGPGSGNHLFITYKLACTDSAGDGIYDVWKLNGVWLDGTTGNFECGRSDRAATCQFIDLPTMGASTSKADIFLQVDWMADANHSLQLSKAAIQRVATAFANSPYTRPNVATGITLHVDEGANSVNFPTGLSKARQLPVTTNLGSGGVNNYKWTTSCTGNTCFDTIKAQPGGFTSTGRAPVFHYVISAQDIAGLGNSGISRGIPGSDYIVSLGTFCNAAPPCPSPLPPAQQGGTLQMQAGTLMHELGHNLGLGHGGGDGTNNKPNYFSIMNYDWQLAGLIVNGVQGTIDYSHSAQPSMNDNALSEQVGLSANASPYGTMHYCPAAGGAPAGFVTVNTASGPIDWNCDGTVAAGTVSFDVSNNGSLATLNGYDDWSNLKLRGGAIGSEGTVVLPDESDMSELTPEVAKLYLPLDTLAPVTTVSKVPAPNAAGWNNSDVTVTLSSSDDISGVARTEYNIDGAGWTQYTGAVVVGSEGSHAVQYRSIDRSQNQETANTISFKIDKTPPTIKLTAPSASGQNGWFNSVPGGISVTANDSLSGVARIDCQDDLPGLLITGGGAIRTLTLSGEGVHHLSCTATDAADNVSGSSTLTIKVDTTPPSCAASANPNSLWPPNHKLVPVSVSLSARDAGSGLQSFTGVKATSNEDMADIAANVQTLNVPRNAGSGNGQTYQPMGVDLTGPSSYAGTTNGQVRSERDGGGSGRTYTLTYTAIDMAGNVATCAATVVVAHDQGH